MAERCAQCEGHAVIHSRNFGFDSRPCPQCEAHAELHAREDGCAGALMMLTITVVLAALRGNWQRSATRRR